MPSIDAPGRRPFDIRSKHETIFTIFMLALTFLFRHHPSLTYPHLLYVFLGFLAFNFLYNQFLKQRAADTSLAYSPIFVNGILITWAIHYSGGETSYLWVMYLLPIFTACLLFEGRGVWITTLYMCFLHLTIYGQGIWHLSAEEYLGLFSHVGLLALSASVTARLASAEKRAQEAMLIQRSRYEETLRQLKGEPVESQDPEGSLSVIARAVHDLNTALTIILGSAQILRYQSPSKEWAGEEDIGRIESAVRLSKVLLQNVFVMSKEGPWAVKESSLHDILRQAIEQCRAELSHKKVAVLMDFKADDDRTSVSPSLMQQAFVNLIYYAGQATPSDKKITVQTRSAGAGAGVQILIEEESEPLSRESLERFFEPNSILSGRGKGAGVGLFLSREVIRRHNGRIQVMGGEGKTNQVDILIPRKGVSDAIPGGLIH